MEQATQFCAAMQQLADLSHPSLVLTLGAVVDGPDAPILVTELMDQCLSTQLQTKNSAGPTMSTVVKQARQIALGVRYLHSKNLTHGNISLSKVLLDSDGCCKLFFIPMGCLPDSKPGDNSAENDIFAL